MPNIRIFLPRGIRFESFRIEHMMDRRGRYHIDLDPAFPMIVKAFALDSKAASYPLNWHERLEIFVAVSGWGQFQMGERVVDYSAGDVLVVDNSKLHGLKAVGGANPRVLSLSFSPELVSHAGSAVSDYEFLAAFYGQSEQTWPVVRDAGVHGALRRLFAVYFDERDEAWFRTGCKAYLLEVLHHLHRWFQLRGQLRQQTPEQRERALRLGRLFDFLQTQYMEAVRVVEAARVIGMSESRFMRFFKQVTGMTFIGYVTHLRLRRASRLLLETTQSVGEIASAVGFADQSYFDRRFKQEYGLPPRAFRQRHT